MPKAASTAGSGRTTRSRRTTTAAAKKAPPPPPMSPDSMIDLTDDASPYNKGPATPAQVKSERPSSLAASASKRGGGGGGGRRSASSALWNTLNRLSSPAGAKTPMSEAASSTSDSSGRRSSTESSISSASAASSAAKSSRRASDLSSTLASPVADEVEEEDDDHLEEDNDDEQEQGNDGSDDEEEDDEATAAPPSEATATPPPRGQRLDMDEDATLLRPAEVESAIDDANAAAYRMGYKDIGGEEDDSSSEEDEDNDDEEDDDGRRAGARGPVFPYALAEDITSRLRDIDDGGVTDEVSAICHKVAELEAPATAAFMAEDFFAPVKTSKDRDPERLFRLCAQGLERVKAAAESDRRDARDYRGALAGAMDRAMELKEEMRNRGLHYQEQVDAKAQELETLECSLAGHREDFRCYFAGEFAFDDQLRADALVCIERGMELQHDRDQAQADLANLRQLQALFERVDGALDAYLDFVVERINALTEAMGPMLDQRRVQRVKTLYKARRTLLRLFEAAVASKNEILAGIDADREEQSDELAKLNRKYVNAGPAIQADKERLRATIAEMTAQYDEHRLALEDMRQEHTNAKTDVILLLEDEKNEADEAGLAMPEDVEEADEVGAGAGGRARGYCSIM